MSAPMTGKMGSLFLQFTPGKKPEYMSCLDLGAIAENLGSSDLIQCRDQNGNVITVGATDKAPTAVKIDFTAITYPEKDVIDRLGKCRVTLYAQQNSCGKLGNFDDWDRWQIIHHVKLTDRSDDSVVMRVDDKETTRKFSGEGFTPVYRGTKLTVSRQSIAETTPLNAITMCNSDRCAGDCGADQLACQSGYLVGDAPAGSPAAYADTWETDDGGSNWTNPGGHPFGAGFDIMAAVCFPLDRSTTRRLVFRGTDPSTPLTAAYSDDGGSTWTSVTIGSTNGEYVAGAKAVKAFDKDHIWVATSEGNIYFSEDGGRTWSDQNALTPSGGVQLNAIDFADFSNGFSVGNTGTIIQTVDGGDTWNTGPVDPSSANNLTALKVFSRYRLIVGANNDGLYQSWDGGLTWESKTFTGQSNTGTIKAIAFANEYCGFMAHNPAAGQGYVHHTIDGGHTWERLATPVNRGLNDVWVCDCNEAFIVGEDQPTPGTGVVLHVS